MNDAPGHIAHAPQSVRRAHRRSRGRNRRARNALLLLVAAIALCAHLAPRPGAKQPRLIWNVSPSVPVGLYAIGPAREILAGDLVALRPSPALARFMASRRYVEQGALLLKPVAALPGTTVCRVGALVSIDDGPAVIALPRDRLRRRLPRWAGCRRLGPRELFVLAPASPDSFDSRYFGPVDTAQIAGRAVPLWTW